jgi:hypothetical protein
MLRRGYLARAGRFSIKLGIISKDCHVSLSDFLAKTEKINLNQNQTPLLSEGAGGRL